MIIKTTILDYPAYWQAKQKTPVPAQAPTPKTIQKVIH